MSPGGWAGWAAGGLLVVGAIGLGYRSLGPDRAPPHLPPPASARPPDGSLAGKPTRACPPVSSRRAPTDSATPDEATTPAELAAREEAARRAVFSVDPSLSLEAQIEGFLARLRASSGVDPSAPGRRLQRGPATEAFLRISALQAQLGAMSPEARRGALRTIRRRFGYSDAQIRELEAVDASKDAGWDQGLAYMAEREALLGSDLESDALEAALADLRQSYFEHRAETIRREEEGGFFRFERPRIYGRN